MTLVTIQNNNTTQIHSHPNEQSGYVISGKYLIEYGQVKETLKEGDSYSIPENIEHSWEVNKRRKIY